jgi:hypothetical protein
LRKGWVLLPDVAAAVRPREWLCAALLEDGLELVRVLQMAQLPPPYKAEVLWFEFELQVAAGPHLWARIQPVDSTGYPGLSYLGDGRSRMADPTDTQQLARVMGRLVTEAREALEAKGFLRVALSGRESAVRPQLVDVRAKDVWGARAVLNNGRRARLRSRCPDPKLWEVEIEEC